MIGIGNNKTVKYGSGKNTSSEQALPRFGKRLGEGVSTNIDQFTFSLGASLTVKPYQNPPKNDL